ncbi:DUF4258 domain-containing protein [Deinococcus marmoris]|uniref:DUF4258 domain-containing protein n=1 Tax=Deinococcus marmoris TaxID=249408 RepID=A0A1U7P4Y8_9DEIO|nr:DUF4258 domain-containing protein [Deinococcus marmoris]OLV20229.1 hypothetical protein BOO71_0000715 [Deinococcus marmoris]
MTPPVFKYTAHAEYQLFNRNITKQAVERTLTQPEMIKLDGEDPDVFIASRETSPGTVLKVWYRQLEGGPVVQTVLIITLRRERPDAPKKPKGRRNR